MMEVRIRSNRMRNSNLLCVETRNSPVPLALNNSRTGLIDGYNDKVTTIAINGPHFFPEWMCVFLEMTISDVKIILRMYYNQQLRIR